MWSSITLVKPFCVYFECYVITSVLVLYCCVALLLIGQYFSKNYQLEAMRIVHHNAAIALEHLCLVRLISGSGNWCVGFAPPEMNALR